MFERLNKAILASVLFPSLRLLEYANDCSGRVTYQNRASLLQ